MLRAGVAIPKNPGQDNGYGRDCDQSPGDSAGGMFREIAARRTDIFGARQLQVWKFLNLRRNLRLWDGRFGYGLAGFWLNLFCRNRRGGGQSLRFPHFVRINLSLAQARDVFGHRFFVIEAEMLGVGANESFVEDAAGQLIEVFFFDGFEHAGADLGDVRNLIERELFFLARVTKFVSEVAHSGAVAAVMLGTS